MDIQLPNDLEHAAQAVASAHGYPSVSAYVVDILKREIEIVEAEQDEANWQNTPEWRAELREWAASHPKTNHHVDTDRDSIYGLRGL
ncbi:MAG: hypothetical protein ABI614_16975 [Planctomycetota bacterium]